MDDAKVQRGFLVLAGEPMAKVKRECRLMLSIRSKSLSMAANCHFEGKDSAYARHPNH